MTVEITARKNTPEDTTRQFELAKLDYERLAAQELNLLQKRSEYWTKFFTILIIPSGYAGVVGVQGARFLLVFICFFLACISLEIRHDEQVLRYDVRRGMKELAKTWGFANHDSQYSNQDGSRWWHSYYKRGRAAAYLMAEIVTTVVVSWGTGLLGLGPFALNIGFIAVTAWCLL